MKKRSVPWSKFEVNIPGVEFRFYETEKAFQIYCAHWLRREYLLRGDESFRWWHHSANERSGGQAGFMAKMMGQSKGFPDFISCRLKMAIELKVPGGKVSDEQKRWMEEFLALGWLSEVVYDFDRFRDLVLNRVRDSDP